MSHPKPFRKDELVAPHPRHRASFEGSRPVGGPDRRPRGQPRHQDSGSERRPRAPHACARARATSMAAWTSSSSSSWMCLHLQAAQEARQRLGRQGLHRDGVGARLSLPLAMKPCHSHSTFSGTMSDVRTKITLGARWAPALVGSPIKFMSHGGAFAISTSPGALPSAKRRTNSGSWMEYGATTNSPSPRIVMPSPRRLVGQ